MRSVEEMTSCQISFTPIQTEDYLSEVNMVLEEIKSCGLEYFIGEMSTIIKGSRAEILKLIDSIYDKMSPRCSFAMDIRLSNTCGCQRQLVKIP